LLKGEPNAKLEIVDISSKPVGINFSNSNGWQLSSNIYIASNVSQIEADLITDGSIFSLSGDNVTENNIFFPYRRKSPNLQRQLYIHGKIISRNTM
jgi:NDP-sugar pyrophosphorylase family protein